MKISSSNVSWLGLCMLSKKIFFSAQIFFQESNQGCYLKNRKSFSRKCFCVTKCEIYLNCEVKITFLRISENLSQHFQNTREITCILKKLRKIFWYPQKSDANLKFHNSGKFHILSHRNIFLKNFFFFWGNNLGYFSENNLSRKEKFFWQHAQPYLW